MTKCWLLRLEECPATALSDEEVARRQSFRGPVAESFALRRSWLRHVLARHLSCEPHEVGIGPGPGRPVVDGMPPGSVSQSTSGLWTAIAIGRSPIGVDIEVSCGGIDVLGFARRYFAAPDLAALEAVPPAARASAFLRQWTAKEAIAKALGRGLTEDSLLRVRVDLMKGDIDGVDGLTVHWPELPVTAALCASEGSGARSIVGW